MTKTPVADQMVSDGLQNLVVGMGTPHDKVAGTSFANNTLSKEQLDNMYRNNWIARKAVDIVPYDMIRAGRLWQANENQITALETAERELKLSSLKLRALSLSRLYAEAILIVSDGTDVTKPFDPTRVKKGGLNFVHVLHRHQYSCGERNKDPLDPNFEEPEFYELNTRDSGSVKIHPSRAIRFIGAPLPDLDAETDCAGDSILQIVHDAVVQAGSAAQNFANLTFDASVDVIKIPDLASHLSTKDGTTRLQERFGLANTMKSLYRMLLLGNNEEYDRKQVNFSNMPELLREYLQIVSGAVDIPATRFLSQSPGGMNSTGEADIRNYYDQISARQEIELRPTTAPLDEALIRHALGNRPDEIHYTFNPLWQITAKEQAEIGKLHAEAAEIYAVNALVPEDVLHDAVKNQLIESGNHPGIEQSYEESVQPAKPDEEDETAGKGSSKTDTDADSD